MTEPQDAGSPPGKDSGKGGLPAWLYGLVAAVLLALVLFAIRNGSGLQKVSVFGLFEIQLAPAPAVPRAVYSHDFLVGTWEVEQDMGAVSGGTTLTYRSDGTVEGWGTRFENQVGQRQAWHGTWTSDRLSDTEFVLHAQIAGGNAFVGKFRIFDRDHIQNEDQNYVAVRMP